MKNKKEISALEKLLKLKKESLYIKRTIAMTRDYTPDGIEDLEREIYEIQYKLTELRK